MSPLPTRFARPLKGALPVAWRSQIHGSRAVNTSCFATLAPVNPEEMSS